MKHHLYTIWYGGAKVKLKGIKYCKKCKYCVDVKDHNYDFPTNDK